MRNSKSCEISVSEDSGVAQCNVDQQDLPKDPGVDNLPAQHMFLALAPYTSFPAEDYV